MPNTSILTHAQACACAFLNARFDEPMCRPPYYRAIQIVNFSLLEEERAISRLLHTEYPHTESPR